MYMILSVSLGYISDWKTNWHSLQWSY
jgi:hypothetical protein